VRPTGPFGAWLRNYLRVLERRDENADVPCGSCNACCRSSYYISIHCDEQETLRRIARVRLKRDAQRAPQDTSLNPDNLGRCPMLRGDACSIYTHRPQTCRKYDCRVFAAAGISLGTGPQNAINERVWQWRFDYPTELDALLHGAVRQAAAFLQRRRDLFPDYLGLSDPGLLAKTAVMVHEVFVDLGAPPLWVTATPSETDIANAILQQLQTLKVA